MFFLSLTLAVLADISPAATAPLMPDLGAADRFDTIAPRGAAHFWDTWHMVTVRYRSDNGEQRFVYANDAAYRTYSAGAKTFPKGAMLAKVAFTTEVDPAFPASKLPRVVSRVQLMLKDEHREHAGWRYAIYPASVRNGDEKSVVAACDACHALVRDRDSVFSVPAFLPSRAARDENAFAGKFTRLPLAQTNALARAAAQVVGAVAGSKVAVLTMPLFAGALSESEPALIAFVRRTGEAYVLYDEESHQYVAAAPQSPSAGCAHPVQTAMLVAGLWGKPIVKHECEAAAATGPGGN